MPEKPTIAANTAENKSRSSSKSVVSTKEDWDHA